MCAEPQTLKDALDLLVDEPADRLTMARSPGENRTPTTVDAIVGDAR